MTTSYAYDDDGSLQSVVYGNGSREDYTYTADKLLKTLVNKAIDGTTIDSYEYTYDAAHNLLSKTDSKGVTSYIYDAMNRLLTVTEPSGKITVYTYDAAGNRASQTETEGTDVTATTYTYDALNRLLRTSESLNGTLSRTVDYTYDNNGNLLTVTSITYTDGIAGAPVLEQNNTYDLLNQLIRTVTSDGTTVENTYNGDGYRVVKSVNGSATRFLYQYDKIVLELNALGDQTGRNVYGLNLISRTFGEDTFFYFYNGHADVTALLASDGTIAATYYYDAFGNILDQTGTATSNILYAGYQYDPETGLYYLNARMYDPVTARFIQEDTYLGSRNDALSLNLYTYCHNEPMMYSDPTGHKESAPKGSTGGMPSEVYNKMYGHEYKSGEATAEYYQEKSKGTNKVTDSESSKNITSIAKGQASLPGQITAFEMQIKGRTIYANQRLADMTGEMINSPNPKNFTSQMDIIAEVYAYTEMDEFTEDMFWDAISWLGTPYVQVPGVKQKNADCGSFIRALYADNGITIEQDFSKQGDKGTAAMLDWIENNEPEKIIAKGTPDYEKVAVKPMDVFFYDYENNPKYSATHVGMVLGQDRNGNIVLIETANIDLNLEIIGSNHQEYLDANYSTVTSKKKGHEDDIVSEYYAGRYSARRNDDIVGVVRYIE